MTASRRSRAAQAAIGAGALLLAALLAWGAAGIPSQAGYAGVGPDFMPWVIATALAACGGWLVFEAASGGFRQLDAPSGAPRGDWVAVAWVAAGLLANATLIEHIGFVLACTVCYTLAVHGLRSAQGQRWGGARQVLLDALTGMLLASPVFWLFTLVLDVNLPGLTATGWL